MPDVPEFSPAEGELVDPDNTVIMWDSVLDAAGYIIEIENDDLEVNLTTKLPQEVTRFELPFGS